MSLSLTRLDAYEIIMFATLDSQNDNASDNSVLIGSLSHKLKSAGLLLPHRASSKSNSIQLNTQGLLFQEKAKEWAQSRGKRGLIQLKILELLKNNVIITDAVLRQITVDSFDAPTDQELLAAISGLEESGLIKPQGSLQSALPIKIFRPNNSFHWLEVLEDRTPPAWQQHERNLSYEIQGSPSGPALPTPQSIFNIHATNSVVSQGNNNILTINSGEYFSSEQLEKINKQIEALRLQISLFIEDTEQRQALEDIVANCEKEIQEVSTAEESQTTAHKFKAKFEEALLTKVGDESATLLISLAGHLVTLMMG